MESFGQRVRRMRQGNVMTQAELAEAADLSWVTINRIENEERVGNPRPSTVRRLADALGVEPSWLLFGDEGEQLKTAA